MSIRPPRQAIALEYGTHEAPVVTARGDAELAERIIAEARRRGVFIAEDPALVGLLGQLDIGESIPPQLYVAVATILSWVYWMRGMVPGDEKFKPAVVEPATPAAGDQASL
jgi:flagellar biosynthesis protein